MNEGYRKNLTPEEAHAKAKHYCAYQERSHQEVKEKLYGFGLYKKDVEDILSRLIEEDYLNEERFACLFAGGKFRMKQWGRVKIMYELKQKRISPYNIRIAMKQIDEEDYMATLQKLAAAKWESLRNEQHFTRQAKTQQYLLQKGFEPALIREAIAAVRPAQ